MFNRPLQSEEVEHHPQPWQYSLLVAHSHFLLTANIYSSVCGSFHTGSNLMEMTSSATRLLAETISLCPILKFLRENSENLYNDSSCISLSTAAWHNIPFYTQITTILHCSNLSWFRGLTGLIQIVPTKVPHVTAVKCRLKLESSPRLPPSHVCC